MMFFPIAMALVVSQPAAPGHSETSPADAALALQSYLTMGMIATYETDGAVEGRYLSFTANGLTVWRRGYESPDNERVGGWYMSELSARRSDLEPVTVRHDEAAGLISLRLRCLPGTQDCIMTRSASAASPFPAQDGYGVTDVSVEFDAPYLETGDAQDMEALFEIWRAGAQR